MTLSRLFYLFFTYFILFIFFIIYTCAALFDVLKECSLAQLKE